LQKWSFYVSHANFAKNYLGPKISKQIDTPVEEKGLWANMGKTFLKQSEVLEQISLGCVCGPSCGCGEAWKVEVVWICGANN